VVGRTLGGIVGVLDGLSVGLLVGDGDGALVEGSTDGSIVEGSTDGSIVEGSTDG
jgi:hypothetical protein